MIYAKDLTTDMSVFNDNNCEGTIQYNIPIKFSNTSEIPKPNCGNYTLENRQNSYQCENSCPDAE